MPIPKAVRTAPRKYAERKRPVLLYLNKPKNKQEVSLDHNKPKQVPIWEKSNLTLTEAAEYFNIGEHKLREITNSRNCNFVLFIGTKRLIKRREFEKYLEHISVI